MNLLLPNFHTESPCCGAPITEDHRCNDCKESVGMCPHLDDEVYYIGLTKYLKCVWCASMRKEHG